MNLIFVHRYMWSHDKKRKKYRRLLKDGKVRVFKRTRDGWYYETI